MRAVCVCRVSCVCVLWRVARKTDYTRTAIPKANNRLQGAWASYHPALRLVALALESESTPSVRLQHTHTHKAHRTRTHTPPHTNVLTYGGARQVDDAVMEDLGAANKKHEYGRHRMWGSIGFGGTPRLSAVQSESASLCTDPLDTTHDTRPTTRDTTHDTTVASGLMGWWLTFHEWVWSLWVFAAAMVGLASIFHYSNMRFPTGRPQVQYAQILTLLTAFRYDGLAQSLSC